MSKYFVILFLLSIITAEATAASNQPVEIATIIPDGTPAAAALRDFSKSVEAATSQRVQFKLKWGGSAGTDPEVLSAIKSGNLQGAMFAGQIMDLIAPDTRRGEIPFQFGSDRQKARGFVARNSGAWNKAIRAAGFHNLGFYEVGFVFLCGKKKVNTVADIRSSKIWLWPGDKLGRSVIEELKGVPIEVPVQDSFKAFSDGRIEFAYAPAIAMVALQWYTKAGHVVTDPISYATGSILIDQKIWNQIATNDQAFIAKQTGALLKKLGESALADERESLDALQSMGVKFNPMGSSEMATLSNVSKSVAKKWQSGR